MNPRPVPLRPDRGAVHREQTQSLHRAMTAAVLGHMRKQTPAEVLRAHWPRDDAADILLRAAQTPLDREHYPKAVGVQLLPIVAPSAAATQLFEKCLRLDLSDLYE